MSAQFSVQRLQKEEDAVDAFCCMSEVPTPWPEALSVCRTWVSQNLGRYVEGYHIQDSTGTIAGQLYYAPSERALVPYQIEPGAAVIYCEWVQRRHQGHGLGHELFAAFERDMRAQGYKGILVEATNREEQMYYGHYVARGFKIVTPRDGALSIEDAGRRKLLYLPLSQPELDVRPLEPRVYPRRGLPVDVLVLTGYLCPFEVSTQILMTEVAREFGERVVLRHEPLSPESLRRYGVADGIFINGRLKLSGGATEEAIRQAIIEEF